MTNIRPAKPRDDKPRDNARQQESRGKRSAVQETFGRMTGALAGRRWIYVLVIVVVLAFIFSSVYWRPIKIYYRELRQATVARAQLREVRAHNEELRVEIRSLETTAGIEEYARRSLGLVEEGDHTIVVYQNGKPINQSGEAVAVEINESPAVKEPFGQWTRFLDRLLLGR